MDDINELAKNRQKFWEDKQDEYYLLNRSDSLKRRRWLAEVIMLYKPKSILEIGCNEGSNLREIETINPSIKLAGIDIHKNATEYAGKTLPKANIVLGSIYDLNKHFKEKFDLVFSHGVTMHIPPEDLVKVAEDLKKITNNIIIHCEQHAEVTKIMRVHNGQGHRWAHNYYALYPGDKVKINKFIINRGGGADHLVTVYLKDTQFSRLNVWYKCSFITFIYEQWQNIKIKIYQLLFKK